jgi:hypothetical protein
VREPADARLAQPVEVVGDHPAEFTFTMTDNLPVVFAFTYYRNSEIRIRGLELERIPEMP